MSAGLQELVKAVEEKLISQEAGLKAGMCLPNLSIEASQEAVEATGSFVTEVKALIKQGINFETMDKDQRAKLSKIFDQLEKYLDESPKKAQPAWDQLKVTQEGDRFDIQLDPKRGMNLQTILESLGDKAHIAYIKGNFPVNLDEELATKKLAIFDKPGTESENHKLIKDKGLELEGSEATNLAVVALLYAKDLDKDAKLTQAEANLLDKYQDSKKNFVRCGPRSASVSIYASGVLRAFDDCWGLSLGLPCGVVPESKK